MKPKYEIIILDKHNIKVSSWGKYEYRWVAETMRDGLARMLDRKLGQTLQIVEVTDEIF